MPKLACAFLAALALLGFGFSKPGIATVYADPLSAARAQDESTYAAAAAGLAARGGWLTPKVLGRYLLVKPPLLVWLSGASLRVLGTSRFALRLPVLLAGALAAALLFLWADRLRGVWVAAAAGLLLAANPLFHTFSRICYTDMLLVLAVSAALYALARDPLLAEPRGILVFGAAMAFAIMAKNVAGLLPVAVLAVFSLLSGKRPAAAAVAKALTVAALLAAPWHLYQIAAHPRWFWADYVQVQILRFGVQPPVQPFAESAVWFYLRRLILSDPLLAVLAAAALPGLVRAARARQTPASLLLAWLAVTGGALLAFRYHNPPYLLYAVPPLALAAAVYGPLAAPRRRKFAVALLAAAFCAKAAWGGPPWGLAFGAGEPIPSASALRRYAALGRPADLITVAPDDEFYAGALPLPKVRYVFIDPAGIVERYAPHYGRLGIALDAGRFAQLERLEPQFRQRLRRWGLDSSEPIGTAIAVRTEEEALRVIEARPHSDFFLPAGMLTARAGAAHRVVPAAGGRVFLLARGVPEPGARVPENW